MRIRHFPDKGQFTALAQHHNVVPICIEVLADTETPVSLLKKLHDGRRAIFLFESVEGGERWGRYSFLGTNARSHIRVFRDAVVIEENGDTTRTPHNGDPLAVLKAVAGRYRMAEMAGLPRFLGGLVGYMNYEMVSFFEAIPNRLAPDTPLAHFIIPDELLIFDNIRHTLTAATVVFIAPEDDPGRLFDDALARTESLLATIAATPLINGDDVPGPVVRISPVVDAEAFRQRVRTVKDHIYAGDIIQAVVSQPFVCDAPADLWMLYRAQRFINPSPYLFFLHFDELALVGSSPEAMVRLENRVATLRPIAGTRPRGRSEQEDRALADALLADEKERAEHLMLVDLGRNDLGRIAETGTVQVTDLMVVERYSHVMHLVSNISCDILDGKDAWDLIRATFPAGTLSGAPKIRAMEIIAELESSPRGPYGGAVGYVSFNGNMDMAITIRTAAVTGGKMIVRAGAGIVADSDPETERQETVNKAMAIQNALQLMSGGDRPEGDQP
ncbi:MAG: anthranilate synthase component I family protein [Pseudomonadota bacterium]